MTSFDHLSQLQIVEIKEAFALLDKDGDGCITTKDLEMVVRSLGLNPNADELKLMIKEVDTDGNGEVDFSEFITMMAKKMKSATDPEDQIRETFQMLDEDGSGEIPTHKLRAMVSKIDARLTEEDIDDMIREVDLDGNGVIDFEEFKTMMSYSK